MATTFTFPIDSSGLVVTPVIMVQTRIAAIDRGVPGFKVLNHINDPGDLPDYGVFVARINDPANPDTDVFVRIATISDFFALPSVRSEAVRADMQYYRSPSWSTFYTDLTIATDGAKTYRDGVNKLVQDWLEYEYAFQAGPPGDVVKMPVADLSVLSVLVSAWETANSNYADAAAAHSARIAEERVASTALQAAISMKSAVADLSGTLDVLGEQSDALRQLIDSVASAGGMLGDPIIPFPDSSIHDNSTLWGAANTLMSAADQTLSSTKLFMDTGVKKLELLHDLLMGPLGLDGARSVYSDMSGRVAAARTRLTNAESAVTDAQAALDAATVAVNAAQVALEDAATKEQAALLAVKNVYPKFDVNNPSASLSA